MREVLGAGRGVQAGEVEIPAMAAEAGRETQQEGAESDAGESDAGESDGSTDATGHKIASAYGCATQHTKPQGFIIRPPLLTTQKKKTVDSFLN
jgi:hypothetical protein